MVPSKAKWSLYWLARHKPYAIVLFAGLLLAASFPPSPLNLLIYVAFVPVFVLFEMDVVPAKVPEDKVFRPFKSFASITFRVLTLQFIWRRTTRGMKVFSHRRKVISGNAQLFRYSYAIFLIWNLLCCYWLTLTAMGANSLLEGLISATAGILAVVLNPALMSIPFQLLGRIRWLFPSVLPGIFLIVFWISFEYLHLNWDLSWSWLNLAHALGPWPSWIQYAEITGSLGVSLHILGGNYLVYLLYRHFFHHQKRKVVYASALVFWMSLPFILNIFLLETDRDVFQSHDSLNVRVVQPNIDPYLKYNYYTPEQQVQLFADLILSEPLDSIDLVILPETAIPRPLNEVGLRGSRILKPLWEIVDSFQLSILTGLEAYQIYPHKDSASISARANIHGVWIDHFNAATVLRPDRSVSFYKKGKLVPMVERIPFLGVLQGLKAYNIDMGTGMGGYGIQDSMTTLATQDSVQLGMMICYESEFGGHARKGTRIGAEMMCIITNDGWWENTSGYIQHAWFSPLRAIENRREIARSANTGRSLFTDVYGVNEQETEWWSSAVIDREVKLYRAQTFYVRHGDWLGRLCLGLTGLILVMAIAVEFWERRKKRINQ